MDQKALRHLLIDTAWLKLTRTNTACYQPAISPPLDSPPEVNTCSCATVIQRLLKLMRPTPLGAALAAYCRNRGKSHMAAVHGDFCNPLLESTNFRLIRVWQGACTEWGHVANHVANGEPIRAVHPRRQADWLMGKGTPSRGPSDKPGLRQHLRSSGSLLCRFRGRGCVAIARRAGSKVHRRFGIRERPLPSIEVAADNTLGGGWQQRGERGRFSQVEAVPKIVRRKA